MKLPIPILICMLSAPLATAQKTALKVNVSANTSLLPDFRNEVVYVERFVIPDLVRIDNAVSPPVVTQTAATTNARIGFNLEVEAVKPLNGHWKWSLAIGVMQLKYDYDTYMGQSAENRPMYLSELSKKHGDTRFTYVTARPLNVTRSLGRFSVQAGPVFNYLIDKQFSNVIVRYDASTGAASGGTFETKGDARRLVWGGHFNMRFAVVKQLEMMVGAQYFFNSLYKKEGTYEELRDKSKALQLQAGVSYKVSSLFR